MEKSFFFNAFPDSNYPTGYDRNINADDLRSWLAMTFETGVVKENAVDNIPQGLRVVAKSALTISLQLGRASIKGSPYINTSNLDFTVDQNGTSQSRYDYIVLRFNNEPIKREPDDTRKISALLIKGTSSVPTSANLTRTENVYEIMLAYIEVKPSASLINQENIVDTRNVKDLCGWFTAVKGFEDYYDAIIQKHESVVKLNATTTNITTTLASKLYNHKYSIVSVYTNGLAEKQDNYLINVESGFVSIIFTSAKASGSEIRVVLENFIDGEGITTALSDYLNWKEAVATLETANEYVYVCNGINDNVNISNIVKAFYSINDYNSAKLRVVGNIGMQAPFGGGGLNTNPYAWFDFVNPVETNRLITIDFSECNAINPIIENGTYNVIFRTSKIRIKGVQVLANNTTNGTNIRVLNATEGIHKVEDSRFYITSYQDGLIALHGTFVNCRGSVANVINNSYCFMPSSNGLLRLIGGEYYAYTGNTSNQSSIVGQSGANAVSILYGVSAPTLARSGFNQTNSILQWTGGGVLSCTDLISELPMIVVSGSSNIRGTITKSKANVM